MGKIMLVFLCVYDYCTISNSISLVFVTILTSVIFLNVLLQAMWFPLLESMMTPQRKLKDVEDKDIIGGGFLFVFIKSRILL